MCYYRFCCKYVVFISKPKLYELKNVSPVQECNKLCRVFSSSNLTFLAFLYIFSLSLLAFSYLVEWWLLFFVIIIHCFLLLGFLSYLSLVLVVLLLSMVLLFLVLDLLLCSVYRHVMSYEILLILCRLICPQETRLKLLFPPFFRSILVTRILTYNPYRNSNTHTYTITQILT